VFDKRRKTFMGIAMWSTVISIIFTTYGTMAFSTNSSILRSTYWAYVGVTNTTDQRTYKVYLGLSAMVLDEEPCNVFGCESRTYYYSDKSSWPNEYLFEEFAGCREFAYGESYGTLLTCFTLIFALIGCANRMRFRSDFHIQKGLGMVTDLLGFINLLIMLTKFGDSCLRLVVGWVLLLVRLPMSSACFIRLLMFPAHFQQPV
jgi:hypothetical protein